MNIKITCSDKTIERAILEFVAKIEDYDPSYLEKLKEIKVERSPVQKFKAKGRYNQVSRIIYIHSDKVYKWLKIMRIKSEQKGKLLTGKKQLKILNKVIIRILAHEIGHHKSLILDGNRYSKSRFKRIEEELRASTTEKYLLENVFKLPTNKATKNIKELAEYLEKLKRDV